MTPQIFNSALNSRAGGVIVHLDPDFGSRTPPCDSELALVRLPNNMHLDVSWSSILQRFVVVLFGDDFETVIAERQEAMLSDVMLAVRKLSDQAYALISMDRTTAEAI